MADFIPPMPLQLLTDMQIAYMTDGKAYNENAIREYVNDEFYNNPNWPRGSGFPLLPVDEPVTFEADPRRADAIRRDDAEAKREVDALREQSERLRAERANADFMRDAKLRETERERDELANRIAELERQQGITTITHGAPPPTTPTASAPAAGEAITQRGRPTPEWTITEMAELAASQGINLPWENARLNTVGRVKLAEFINGFLDGRPEAVLP